MRQSGCKSGNQRIRKEPNQIGAGAYLDESYANCTRKHSYATQARAQRAAIHTFKAGRTSYYRTYQCPLCNGWHWTHQRPLNKGEPI